MDNQYQDPNQNPQNGYQQPDGWQHQSGYQQPGGGCQQPGGGYPQPPYQRNEADEVLSMGQWLLTLIIVMIPCVNIIMLLVWAFGSNGNNNRKNFCRAQLIILLVQALLGILLASTLIAALTGLIGY